MRTLRDEIRERAANLPVQRIEIVEEDALQPTEWVDGGYHPVPNAYTRPPRGARLTDIFPDGVMAGLASLPEPDTMWVYPTQYARWPENDEAAQSIPPHIAHEMRRVLTNVRNNRSSTEQPTHRRQPGGCTCGFTSMWAEESDQHVAAQRPQGEIVEGADGVLRRMTQCTKCGNTRLCRHGVTVSGSFRPIGERWCDECVDAGTTRLGTVGGGRHG